MFPRNDENIEKIDERFGVHVYSEPDGKLVYNFSPGPGTLPRAVLDKASQEMLNFRGSGRGVMELSHRSPEFSHIDVTTKRDIKEFLKVPDTHVVMMQHGGATMQFSAIVKNLIGYKPARKGMFFTSGSWSRKCINEARKFIPADKLIEVTDLSNSGYNQMTDPSTWNIDPEASFFHICMNETVHGMEIAEKPFPWHLIPKDVICVGDLSSNMGTYDIDWERFGCVYAGAHKNMGPAGAAIIIVRKDLLNYADPDTPGLSDWKANWESKVSDGNAPMYFNTPPVWSIYVIGLNVRYMIARGGIETYRREALIKSQMLYDVLDASNGYYVIMQDKAYRSRINVIFRIGCPVKGMPELEQKLKDDAKLDKIVEINGHAENPGLRVSMYNGMPVAGVAHLCRFLVRFMRENPISGIQTYAKM